MFWFLLYNVFVVPLGWILFQLLGLFDKKVRRGIQGRENLFEQLQHDVTKLNKDRKRVWFHSSSLGEFEQAKPIIAELKRRHPEVDVIVSFFSPSGFEHSRSYKFASLITYLPFDSARNAGKFIELVKPTAAVMVRYDVWPNHLWALQKEGIPTFIANATLQENAVRNLPLIKQFHQAMYNALDYILTVSESDKKMFEMYHLTHPVLEVIGDTRYDQVVQRSSESRSRHVLSKAIVMNKKILIVGSSWEEDEVNLLPAFYKLVETNHDLIMVLVPHEPSIENLDRIENRLNGYASWTRFSNLGDYRDQKIIIVDSVGILMSLYQYAHIAYVGGSFRQGVHNVLEPASYGLPIIVGPKHDNSQEAVELITNGAAFVGDDPDTLYRHIRSLLEDEEKRSDAGKNAALLVRRNTGATERFLSYLEKVL
jgi:3-deoxy-D-manno-octulosonic-acid transferase